MAEATKDTDKRFDRDDVERRAPDDVTDLPKQSWKGVLKRTAKEFNEDKLTDWCSSRSSASRGSRPPRR